MKRLVAICRTIYCWMFLYWSVTATYVAYTNIHFSARTHSINKGVIFSSTVMALYSLILGIAWWEIFRGKPALKQWATAANLVFIFTYLPELAFGNWQAVLRDELNWWPVMLIGIFGIFIFSIPYHGWRDMPQNPVS